MARSAMRFQISLTFYVEPVAGDAFHGSLQALQSATRRLGVQDGDQGDVETLGYRFSELA